MDKFNCGTADALEDGERGQKRPKKSVTVSAKVTLAQREEIKNLVKEIGLKDVSELVTLAISEFLKRYEGPSARHVDASLTDELIRTRLMSCPLYRTILMKESIIVDQGTRGGRKEG